MAQEAALDRQLIEAEINRVLEKGSLISVLLGVSCAPMLYGLSLSGIASGLEAPALWSLSGGLYSIVVHFLARYRLIRGWVTWLVMILFTFFVSSLFLASHFLLPGGAATFLTGPPVLLYFFMIALSALAYDARLSFAIGAICGIQFFLFYLLGRDQLQLLGGADPLLLQDLQGAPIQLFKSLMMAFTGALTGYLSVNARRLIFRAIEEEREKSAISRLFGQFVSDEVKDKIVRERHGLVGENKSLAILFCDLRGFSSLSEGLAPEAIVAQLNEYFDRMTECIVSEGGTIDKFIGDAIMAVFGGVRELENPSAAALDAALKMLGVLRLLNTEREQRGLPGLKNGIGIHYGPALLGAIGAAERKDFTVIGDSVNIASRIEGLCKELGSDLLISAEVAEHLPPASRSALIELGQFPVKGRQQPVRLFGPGPALV